MADMEPVLKTVEDVKKRGSSLGDITMEMDSNEKPVYNFVFEDKAAVKAILGSDDLLKDMPGWLRGVFLDVALSPAFNDVLVVNINTVVRRPPTPHPPPLAACLRPFLPR